MTTEPTVTIVIEDEPHEFTFDNAIEYWNWEYRPGIPVLYWLGARVGDGIPSVTRTTARMVDGHPVVLVEGHNRWLSLGSVERDPEG